MVFAYFWAVAIHFTQIFFLTINKNMRKLATLRLIGALAPIPNADNIEMALIDGWEVVVRKGDHEVDQMIVYFEIDSWIPHEIAPFLFKKEKDIKVYENVKGMRLRSMKFPSRFGSPLSQGLVMNIKDLPASFHAQIMQRLVVGADLTELLGVLKYEEDEYHYSGGPGAEKKTNWPSFIRKTDQERIQNLSTSLKTYNALTFEVTEKMDGSSMTMLVRENMDGTREDMVCSRNWLLDDTCPDQKTREVFCGFAKTYLEQLREKNFVNLAFQGELIGPTIQKNRYGTQKLEFYLFDIFDIKKQVYLHAGERGAIVRQLSMLHCPTFGLSFGFKDPSIKAILASAEGKSEVADCEREGLVYKCMSDPSISFKVISNKYLLEIGKKEQTLKD
jgi:RNA ligase (TIGR02306 family)